MSGWVVMKRGGVLPGTLDLASQIGGIIAPCDLGSGAIRPATFPCPFGK